MRVKKVDYLRDYKLKLTFGNNAVKVVDLENMIQNSGRIFLPLKDMAYFKRVALDDSQLSICWPNGADICPDVLYEMSKDLSKKKTPPANLSRRATNRRKSRLI